MTECKTAELKGLISNLQRFSVHDGPGIRTTIFMQGCPLRCKWCANPESWKTTPVILVRDVKCIGCGKCVAVCPFRAISMDKKGGRCVDFTLCTQCRVCASVCPTQAIAESGKYLTIDEVVQVAERDSRLYENSGGGVTISGGEPGMQTEFVERLMQTFKEQGLHVALDTCGQVSWSDLKRLVSYANLVLFDIKHMDTKEHRIGTGHGNEEIIENVTQAANITTIWLRVPLISGYNDSEKNIMQTANLGKRIGARKISLLPYHRWGESKYEQLGLPYTFEGEAPDPQKMKALEGIIKDYGLEVGVGS